MSIKSQENNMRRIGELLGKDLSNIDGEKECGPNGDKKLFLHIGRVFLRALAKDLGLHNATVISNAAGLATSGECCLTGMWGEGGVYVCLSQFTYGGNAVLYRSVRNSRDHKGGCNHFLSYADFSRMSYTELLGGLLALRKEAPYELAA